MTESAGSEKLGFVHRFVAGEGGGGCLTLLLLHGTGGDEADLLPLGRMLAPGAALLSPRGKVLERGMPRFFRRLSEGVFDEDDLRLRTKELVEFVGKASKHYDLDPSAIVAVGFSNGANIAASIMLQNPAALGGAVLFRPMLPFEPNVVPRIPGTPVFVSAGLTDSIVPRASTERLVTLLSNAGAAVTLHFEPAGHELGRSEIDLVRRWLQSDARLLQER